MDGALFTYLLRLGDDALLLAQRLTEWSGKAPTIEVDLSLSNIGLDLLGQASVLLNQAGQVEGAGRDADRLAFHRDAHQFCNCMLVEQPNGDFAQTMARQFLFSSWQKLLFTRLATSADAGLAALAAKALKEVSYHAEIAADWVVRLGDGTDESHQRMARGLGYMWRFVPELFATDDVEADLAARGIAVDPASFQADWDAQVDGVLARATLERPADQRPLLGGRTGRHSEHLGHMLAELQYLPRAYPDARW